MLNKPDIQDQKILDLLNNAYGIQANSLDFLPIGADFNTVVYRAKTSNQQAYFVKLRKNEFNQASVLLPNYLAKQNFKAVIAPIQSIDNQLSAPLESYQVILYPYVDGQNAVDKNPTEQQWIELGQAMNTFHNTKFPANIIDTIPQENFDNIWSDKVKEYLQKIETQIFSDATATSMAEFLKTKSEDIITVVNRIDKLAQSLKQQSLEYCVCHGDLHGWNLQIDTSNNLYIIDWDTLILAPKERDLMFIGAGIWDSGRSANEQQTLFYQGYQDQTVHLPAITYYRYQRIIQDIGEYCDYILMSDQGGDDRHQCLQYLKSNFKPNGTLATAFQSDSS